MQSEALDPDPIRILLGPMPEMLCAMIKDLLASEADMEVVGQSGDLSASLIRARNTKADMLIAQATPSEQEGFLDAIVCGPPLSVLAIAPSGEGATAVRLAGANVAFDAASRSAFADAIREAAKSSKGHFAGGKRSWLG